MRSRPPARWRSIQFSTELTTWIGDFRAKPKHRIDAHRDPIARDRLLRFQLIGDDARINPHDAVDEGDQPVPAGPLHLAEAAEAEQHGALIFAVDAEALERGNEQHDHDDRENDQCRRYDHS